MRRFRVLLVVPLAGIGGTELSTLSLATGLKQAGHQVYVMCNAHPLMNEFTKQGLEVVLAGMERNPTGLIKDAARMRRCITENKIEIIHFQSAFAVIMSLLCRGSIKSNRVKVIWTCRGIKHMSYFIVGRLFNFLTDFVIGNCNAERDKLISTGLSPRKVRTVYNCPNIAIPEDASSKSKELLDEMGIDSDTPIVGTASRLAPSRGVEYFMEAAALISRQIPKARFIIAGGGPIEGKLRRQASDLNIEEHVFFLGPRRDMERVFSIMDLFVNPCPLELGTGNTNAEAMAFGKPVIAVNRGGTPEIVEDGVTGILVPGKNPEKLAEATLRLLQNKDLARRMGLAGWERVMREFSLERLVREVEEVYDQVSTRATAQLDG